MSLQIKYQPNIHQWGWYDTRSEDCTFCRNQAFNRSINHLFVYFFDHENEPIWQLDYVTSLDYQLECYDRGLVCNCTKISQLLWVCVQWSTPKECRKQNLTIYVCVGQKSFAPVYTVQSDVHSRPNHLAISKQSIVDLTNQGMSGGWVSQSLQSPVKAGPGHMVN